jgi:hypothetical protein
MMDNGSKKLVIINTNQYYQSRLKIKILITRHGNTTQLSEEKKASDKTRQFYIIKITMLLFLVQTNTQLTRKIY